MSNARKANHKAKESVVGSAADTAIDTTTGSSNTMSNTTAEINSFLESTRRMAAPITRANELTARTFEKIARYNYEVAGDWLNLSLAQLQAATQSKDVQEIVKKQAELASSYFEKQTQRSQDFMKIATDVQADLTHLIDAATTEFSRGTRAA